MAEYDYRVIAAPSKGVKARGKKSPEDRFSHALELRINEMAADGWEYQRAETLPAIERAGLTSTRTIWHNVLVFRRPKPVPVKEIPMVVPPIYGNRPKDETPPETGAPQQKTSTQASDTGDRPGTDASDTAGGEGSDDKGGYDTAKEEPKPSRGAQPPLVAQRRPPDAIS